MENKSPPPLKKRYVSLWLPKWSIDCCFQHAPRPTGPYVQTIKSKNKTVIRALNLQAEKHGVQEGMSLATARAICAELTVVDFPEQYASQQLDRLAGWADQFTPFVACDGDEGLILDITGCAHLFGGEDQMLVALSDQLKNLKLHHRLAIADTPACAWALSHFGNKNMARQTAPLHKVAKSLLIEALRLPTETILDLHRMGLRKVHELMELPRASLAKRYGLDVATRLDLLLGDQHAPISPRLYKTPYNTRLSFPDAIGLAEDIEAGLDRLILQLSMRLEKEALGARRLYLACEKVDKTSQLIMIGTSEPTYHPKHLKRLFQEKISEIEPGFGIDTMRLMAPMVEPLKHNQFAIHIANPSSSERTRTAQRDELNLLVDRLKNRLGANAVGHIRPKNSHRPDQTQGWNIPTEHEWAQTRKRPSLLYVRPIHLQDETFPTELRHQGKTHTITKTWGPERISPDWWQGDENWQDGARDYYRVEVATGAQYWIYQEPRNTNKSWFMHGCFA